MNEEERFEIQISEGRELVRRMDRQIDLVDRLLAETETSVRTVHPEFTNSIGMELVWCQPGTFWMGSPEDEEGRYEHETLHEVTLTRGFWIGRHPVTQGQWEEVMGGNTSYFTMSGSDAPVDSVSWNDAQEFLQALGRRDGREYRLPTEAEWEYACRAGSTGPWCFGNDEEELKDYAWYRENRGLETHPVGQKKPNAWGIYDIHGNVWEWCADWYGDYPAKAVVDPSGPRGGSYRVYRGGSWDNIAEVCRSAYRDRDAADYRTINFGFRVAVSSIPEKGILRI